MLAETFQTTKSQKELYSLRRDKFVILEAAETMRHFKLVIGEVTYLD